ncbi:hypothetical protein L9F63_011588, partial [Diploptera punctata]
QTKPSYLSPPEMRVFGPEKIQWRVKYIVFGVVRLIGQNSDGIYREVYKLALLGSDGGN